MFGLKNKTTTSKSRTHLKINNRNTERAILFNRVVVLTHNDSEPTMLTPVSTPRVSTDPVFGTILINAPTGNLNLMIDPTRILASEDASVIIKEVLIDVDTTRNRTTSSNFSLHLLHTRDRSVLTDLVALELSDRPAAIGVTVGTKMFRSTIQCLSDVVLAGGIRNTLLVSPLVDTIRPTTLAGTSTCTVDNSLRREINGREGTISHQIDTIRESRGGTLSPAGTTIDRNVLILVPRSIVETIKVTNIISLRDLIRLEVLMRTLGSDVLTMSPGVLSRSATRTEVLLLKILLTEVDLDLFFRHHRSGPEAAGFDREVVLVTNDTEEAVFTPVGTPGVTNNPVLLTVLLTPTNDRDGVAHGGGSGGILEDAAVVLEELVGDGNTADDGTTGVDFLHHVGGAGNCAELIGVVSGEVLDGVAAVGTISTAISADTEVIALAILSFVVLAALFRDADLGEELVGVVGVTAVAAEIAGIAVEENLDGEIVVGPLSLAGDSHTVGEGGKSGEGPAGAAVLGQVLVSDGREVTLAINVTTRNRGEGGANTDRRRRGGPRRQRSPEEEEF